MRRADSRQNPSNERASIVPRNESLSREPNSRTRAFQETPFIVRRIETAATSSRSSIRSYEKEDQHGSHRTIVPPKCQKPSVDHHHENEGSVVQNQFMTGRSFK